MKVHENNKKRSEVILFLAAKINSWLPPFEVKSSNDIMRSDKIPT